MGRTLVLTDWAENLPSDWRNLLASSVFPRGMVGLGQCQRARNSEDGGKNATAFQHNCSIPNTGLLPPNWRKRGLGLRSTRNAKKCTQIESMQVGRVGRASHRPPSIDYSSKVWVVEKNRQTEAGMAHGGVLGRG